jgi:hypothetical protein
MGKFRRDLALGNQGEAAVQKILQEGGIRCAQTDGRNYDLEAFLDEKTFKIEVKYDLYAARSGNIAIEFWNPKSGKASGVKATVADLWAHVITKPASVWVAKVDKLKTFVETVKPHKVIACGGDDNASLFLYRQDVICEQLFVRIDELKGNDVAESIRNILWR